MNVCFVCVGFFFKPEVIIVWGFLKYSLMTVLLLWNVHLQRYSDESIYLAKS